MKSLKTYNMDQDCVRILSTKPNKSQYVCRAVRRLEKNIEHLDADLIDTRILLINLKHREVSEALKTLLELELSTQV
jgi:hypothetical protein